MDTTAVIHSSTPDAIAQLTVKVTELERSAEIREGILSKSFEKNRLHEAYVDNFIETLANYVKDGDIDHEVATDLAECFGRELTRTVLVHTTMLAEMELTIPVHLDVDDLKDEFDIDIKTIYASDVTMNYYDISQIEVDEQ